MEGVGGHVAGSLAIFTDAAHLFADFAAFAIAVAAHRMADRPPSQNFTYGLKRMESLAAFLSMILLDLVCLLLFVEALKRLYYILFDADKYVVDSQVMTGIAAVGVVVNIVLACILGENHVHLPGYGGHDHSHGSCNHGHSHGHAHHDSSTGCHDEESPHGHGKCHGHEADTQNRDHSHKKESANEHDHEKEHAHNHGHEHNHDHDQCHNHRHNHEECHDHEHNYGNTNEDVLTTPLLSWEYETQEPTDNVNMRAAYIHALGDLAQSMAVLVTGIIIWIEPTWTILDPLISLAFCILVFWSTFGVIKNALYVLLEAVPPGFDWNKLCEDLNNLPDVKDVHDLHVWSIGDGKPAASLHATSVDPSGVREVMSSIRRVLTEDHHIEHMTIQIQPGGLECAVCQFNTMNCKAPAVTIDNIG